MDKKGFGTVPQIGTNMSRHKFGSFFEVGVTYEVPNPALPMSTCGCVALHKILHFINTESLVHYHRDSMCTGFLLRWGFE